MINFVFFLSVFSSCSWLIFCWKYLSDKLQGVSISSLGALDVLVFAIITTIPLFIIWMIFGHIAGYINNRKLNKKISRIWEQSKRNQEYSDLIARVLIENEQSTRAGIIIGKFDFFISELNEIISDILHQLGTSEQKIYDTWGKVESGEKWSLGRFFIEIANQNSKFTRDLLHRTKIDESFSDAVLQFCTTYQNVLNLLDKNDKDRFFYNTIENGVFGKIFCTLSPIFKSIEEKEEQIATAVVEKIEPRFEAKQAKKTIEDDEPIQIASNSEIKEEKSSWLSGFFDKKKDKEPTLEKIAPLINKDSFYMFIENGKSKKDEAPRKEPMLSEADDEYDRMNR